VSIISRTAANPVRLEEHVFGAAEADPFAPNSRATLAIVGVSALVRDLELSELVPPSHQCAEVSGPTRRHGRHLTEHHFAQGAVDFITSPFLRPRLPLR